MLLNPFLTHLSFSNLRAKHQSQAVPGALGTQPIQAAPHTHVLSHFCQSTSGPRQWSGTRACRSRLTGNVPSYSWTLHPDQRTLEPRFPAATLARWHQKCHSASVLRNQHFPELALRRMAEHGSPLNSLLRPKGAAADSEGSLLGTQGDSQQCGGEKEGLLHQLRAERSASPGPHPQLPELFDLTKPQLVPTCPEGEMSKTIDPVVHSQPCRISKQAMNLC